jgi:hypothetical protein
MIGSLATGSSDSPTNKTEKERRVITEGDWGSLWRFYLMIGDRRAV